MRKWQTYFGYGLDSLDVEICKQILRGKTTVNDFLEGLNELWRQHPEWSRPEFTKKEVEGKLYFLCEELELVDRIGNRYFLPTESIRSLIEKFPDDETFSILSGTPN